MASTPEEWLPILTKRLDAEQTRVRRLKQYVDGNAPLPEMGKNLRASWQRFQRKARTNLGLMITDPVVDRIIPIGIQIAGSSVSDEAKQSQRIWRDNRMDVVVKDFVRAGVTYSVGYLCLWAENGKAVITAESPEFMYAATDPLRPWITRAAIKVWRDEDLVRDYCYVWAQGGRQRFSRASQTSTSRGRKSVHIRASSTDWKIDGEYEEISGDIPVYAWENPGGYGEFELHTDLIDRCNLGVLQRLVTTAMQAFRQRALKRPAPAQGQGFSSDQDDDGDDIDMAAMFEPAPGAIWDLPDGMELWESQTTDITPMLSAEKNDLRTLAAATRTPVPMLAPDDANQTATGAVEQTSGMYFKARDKIAVVSITLAAALLKALRIEDTEPSGTIEVLCESPDRVSLTEKYAAAAQAKAAGESWKSIARNILGYSPDQIAQDEIDRAAEALSAMALVDRATEATGGAPASAPHESAAETKARADAMGVLIRAGVNPQDAAARAGFDDMKFTGATPVSLRLPESQAAALEGK